MTGILYLDRPLCPSVLRHCWSGSVAAYKNLPQYGHCVSGGKPTHVCSCSHITFYLLHVTYWCLYIQTVTHVWLEITIFTLDLIYWIVGWDAKSHSHSQLLSQTIALAIHHILMSVLCVKINDRLTTMKNLCCWSGTRGSNFSATGRDGGEAAGRGLTGDLPFFISEAAVTRTFTWQTQMCVCVDRHSYTTVHSTIQIKLQTSNYRLTVFTLNLI